MRLFILGSNGLLGSHLEYEAAREECEYVSISRTTRPRLQEQLQAPSEFVKSIGARRGDYIINALGVTRHRILSKWPGSSPNWVNAINVELPQELGKLARRIGCKVLQVGTDCVFSGEKGAYLESDTNDASDTYGLSKVEGESAPGINVIRASFVGPSKSKSPYLWDWIEHQEPNARIHGFSNVVWNGVTASVHARLAVMVAKTSFKLDQVQHLVPEDAVTKEQLLRLIVKATHREDLIVEPSETLDPKNMTLSTGKPDLNSGLWNLLGYESAPRVQDLILPQSAKI